MKLVYFFLISFIFSSTAFVQNKQPLNISFIPKTGFLIAHRANMSHLVKGLNTAYELEFSQQDNRRNFTSNYYQFPSRGFSIQYQNFGYNEVLGQAFSIFQFTKFNWFQHEKFGFVDFRIASGLSYITKEYDVVSNPKNNAIGSHINAFIDFQIAYTNQINKFNYGLGISMSHYSNAAIQMPNLGLNSPLVFVKLGYQFNQREIFTNDTNPVIDVMPRYTHRFMINAIGGVKQNLPGQTISPYYPIFATQFLYRKYLSFKWDFEIGCDLIYNRANQFKYDNVVYNLGEAIQLGFTVGMAANFYKSQIFFGVGSYVYNKINPSGWIYNRIGYRYFIKPHLSALVAIKANIGIADYLEFGIGWNL